MPRGIAGVWEYRDTCAVCGVPKDQHRRDQKLRPGQFPCLHGGSHKFAVWIPGDNPDCKRCNPNYLGAYRHTCQDTTN
ncbi:hypothetical protein KDJ01_gp27 [Arthrobacter phage Kittykat]|uniref:Uncharacterized protein n=1 Tax=Arthrobacter phage Kittykat TaxID=2794944 RepID=A0A7T1KRX4_9CAUD|nr:hypothetical protein KDJ01_gp27 [Arthrobacter phage Kittykat]QPO16959.1 hypothetical protein SEA_KITTYKAT_27 [Arthrobacter phage Kittykat]